MGSKGPGQSVYVDSATERISPHAKPDDKFNDGVLGDGAVSGDDGAGEASSAAPPIPDEVARDQTTVDQGGREPTSVPRSSKHTLFGLKSNGTQARTGNRRRRIV